MHLALSHNFSLAPNDLTMISCPAEQLETSDSEVPMATCSMPVLLHAVAKEPGQVPGPIYMRVGSGSQNLWGGFGHQSVFQHLDLEDFPSQE